MRQHLRLIMSARRLACFSGGNIVRLYFGYCHTSLSAERFPKLIYCLTFSVWAIVVSWAFGWFFAPLVATITIRHGPRPICVLGGIVSAVGKHLPSAGKLLSLFSFFSFSIDTFRFIDQIFLVSKLNLADIASILQRFCVSKPKYIQSGMLNQSRFSHRLYSFQNVTKTVPPAGFIKLDARVGNRKQCHSGVDNPSDRLVAKIILPWAFFGLFVFILYRDERLDWAGATRKVLEAWETT